MWNYSMPELKFLPVNCTVAEWLGVKFTMYTKNNPLIYVKGSKFGWLKFNE